MVELELLPCPFCGGTATHRDNVSFGGPDGFVPSKAYPLTRWVACMECEAETGKCYAEAEAARRWNKRKEKA